MSISVPKNLFRGIAFSLTLGMMGLASTTMAQPPQSGQQPVMPQQKKSVNTDYSKEEIKSFLDAQKVAQQIQMSNRKEMMNAIKSTEGIDLATFKQIQRQKMQQQRGGQGQGQMQQSGGMGKSKFSDAQMQAFDKASSKVMQVQRGMMQTMQKEIPKKAGMEFSKYRQMAMAIQKDPELQSEVRSMMQKRQKGQGGGQMKTPQKQ